MFKFRKFKTSFILFTTAPCLALLSGCGGVEGRGTVKGTVRFDGEPIAEGSIQFSPTGGNKGPAAGATIENGEYFIPAEKGPPVGLNRVEIRAVRKTGRKVTPPQTFGGPPQPVDELVQFIPPQYNEQSTLEKDVAAGQNVFDFDLESSP